MKLPRRQFLHLAAGAAALPAISQIASAQAYPSRPVTIIVPFAAGGGTDVSARIVGDYMSRTLGQQFIIENVPGAGGTTGSIRAMRAKADGYTILMGHIGTHAFSVSLYPNLAYKPDVDFEPIGVAVEMPEFIVARKDFPANDLKEFITYVKANAETLNMAHAGVGSITFTFGLLLNSLLGVKPTTVPFSGVAPATAALLGGQVDYMCLAIEVRPHVQAGTIKAYAIAATERHPALPNVRQRRTLGCRNSRHCHGLPCLRRRACRDRYWTGLPTRWIRHWTTTTCASAWSISAVTFRARQSEVSRRSPRW